MKLPIVPQPRSDQHVVDAIALAARLNVRIVVQGIGRGAAQAADTHQILLDTSALAATVVTARSARLRPFQLPIWEVRALAQLRDRQIQCPCPGVELMMSIPIALIGAFDIVRYRPGGLRGPQARSQRARRGGDREYGEPDAW